MSKTKLPKPPVVAKTGNLQNQDGQPKTIDEPDRRQRKVNQTLSRVTEIAWAMFESTGYENVTMESISAQADIAKATLYKYFPTKESILDQHFKAEMRERRDDIQNTLLQLQGLRARLTYLFEVEAEYLRDKYVYLAPLLKHRTQNIDLQQNPSASSGMLTIMTVLFKAAQAASEIPKKHSPETLAHYLNAMRTSDLFYWQANPEASLLARHQEMLNLFLLGVLGDQDNATPNGKESK